MKLERYHSPWEITILINVAQANAGITLVSLNYRLAQCSMIRHLNKNLDFQKKYPKKILELFHGYFWSLFLAVDD